MRSRLPRLVFVLALVVAACASLPRGFEQLPSVSWQTPESTELARVFGAAEAAADGDSGVALLADPRAAYRARMALANLAEHTLDLQYFLWKGDLSGQLLLDQILEAADRGVRVRVLIDDIYHRGRDRVYAAIDAHPQVEIRVFNPMGNRGVGSSANFFLNKGTLNHRMHNKIYLADNAVAILGGRNIGDDYFGIDPKLNFRDLDVLAAGPAAREAGAAYDLYWNSSVAVPIAVLCKRRAGAAELAELRAQLEASLVAARGFPYAVPMDSEHSLDWAAEAEGVLVWAPAEVVVDPLERFGGKVESEFIRVGRELDASLTHELVAHTAYLIPSEEGVAELARLVARGVSVRILTNSLMSNNHLSVHAHYMKYRKALLRAGVELHELRADAELLEHFEESEHRIADSHAGFHTKAFVFDRRHSLIGSYNMDPRSRIWNSEIGLLVDSREFAEQVLVEMERDFDPSNSYELSLDAKGRLRWTGVGPAGVVVWAKDPQSPAWRRLASRIISWLPIEGEL